MGRIQEHYYALIAKGEIAADPAQIAVIAGYDTLLRNIEENWSVRRGFFSGWLTGKCRQGKGSIKGLYVYGEVGRGKTMLMDMFFSCLPDGSKRRVHFHVFMNDVHDRVKAYRQASARERTKQDTLFSDIAAALAEEAHILCFDEFAVTDIADAMILSRLFTELFRRGVVLIATSNVSPDNLYYDGLNRLLFLPFIEILKDHVDVVNLDAPLDYRRGKIGGPAVYMMPLDRNADERMDMAWKKETQAEGVEEQLTVRGHEIKVPCAVGSIARFEFSDLCSRALSAFDYMALATRYRTFFIHHVPVLDDDHRDEAKRFILLIDTLYDHHARLFISADAPPDKLYQGNRKITESFEFARTASRLFEMQGESYLRDWAKGDPRK